MLTGIREDVNDFLLDAYGENIYIEHFKINIPVDKKNKIEKQIKQKFYRDNLHCWSVSVNDSTTYIAVLDNTIGKSMPITFLVVIDDSNCIVNSKIIKYREPYGGEVQHKVWLSQFLRKDVESLFKIGKDIDGISGATISAHSVNKGIQKVLHLVPYIRSQIK